MMMSQINSLYRLQQSIEIWVVDITISPTEYQSYKTYITNSELEQSKRFQRLQDQKRFILTRAHLRFLLSYYIHEKPLNIQFLYGKFGKPALSPSFFRSTNIHFNLSHSHRKIVLAFTCISHIGIDIEYHAPRVNVHEIARMVFTPREQNNLRTLLPSQLLQAFYDGWTRKEAFVKGIGVGLSIDLTTVELLPTPEAFLISKKMQKATSLKWLANNWTLTNLFFSPKYSLAFAIQASQMPAISLLEAPKLDN